MKKNKKTLYLIAVAIIVLLAFALYKNQPQADDNAQIETILQKEIPAKSAVKSFEVINLSIKNDFAKATIKPLDVETDNAFVVLQKKNENWEVIWGPGTVITEDDPIFKMIPKDL